MDIIDAKILEVLKQNGRSTASDISKKVNLSIPAVSERIRKLEEANVIEQYTVKINREKMGYKLLAIVFVNIDHTANIQQFREEIILFPEVMECHHMAGEYDYMLKVLVEDTAQLEVFLSEKLKSIRGVQNSNTLIVLSTLTEKLNR
ncbi:Lrp/AsnC family transcriptional regulator [Psychrobacillus lasiicapitis]|uniref:Lrp/AsnC family transcriptional regulator n=1 Tax=Psychrobacillus lasiicapitis TaxID=1636719 RepID=A0A544T1J9_9BACI|nr:Lrp/AsnC family transcriptional regulator [Psychrobacillus lasiicapitis]TQR11318.1 Lrp/AsnC family transcriptional regulator [Psychrobacillus lasiicapitis]GGA41524.1 AsnC family transcriptional regulator [Psychrobacillus lasiicapitis]